MFNPRPAIRYVPLMEGHVCAVVDDFLLDPGAMVKHARTERARFGIDADNSYPGPELGLSKQYAFALDEFFMQHVRKALGARRTLGVSSRLSLATLAPHQLSPLQRLCHRDAADLPGDQGVAACVAYLFDNARLGGTSFYRPTRALGEIAQLLRDARDGKVVPQAAYLTSSNDAFEQVASIPAAWNRAIFYDGGIFHAAQISEPALLRDDPATGRLTMNGFFRYRKAAA